MTARVTLQNTPATLGDISGWSVGETTNPPTIGLPNPGTGGVSGSAAYGSESELAIEKDATFTATPFPGAEIVGTIESATVTGSAGMDASVDWSMGSYFGGLSVDRVAPPILNQTLGSILQTYIGLVYSNPIPVQSSRVPLPGFDSDIYSFPGWSGNVWAHICDLLARVGAEIVYWPDTSGQPAIEVRPLSSMTLDLDDKTPPIIRYESGSPGHQVDVVYQNQRVITSVLPDLDNLSENPSLESNSTGWSGSFMDGSSITADLTSVTWGAGTFVAVGNNFAATSPDGLEWTVRTIPSGNYLSVAWNGSIFAAYDATANVSTSPDGITWTSQGSTGGYFITSARSGPSVFMSAEASEMGISADGVNWNMGSLSGYYRDIAYGGGVFVAVGEGVAASSTNGTTWTSRTIANRNFRAVTWGDGMFVAAGWDGLGPCLASSPDGINWTSRTAYVNAETIAWGNGLFVVSSGSDIATSTDGISWIPRTSIPAGAPGPFPEMAHGESVFVMVGMLGSATSPDGITWANYTVPDPSYASASRESDPARAFAGDYSMRLRLNVPPGIGIAGRVTASRVDMPDCDATTVRGAPVTIGAWVSIHSQGTPPPAGNARLLLTFLDSNGGTISRHSGGVVTSTGFSTWSGTVPASAETVASSILWVTSVYSTSGFGTDVRLHADAHMVINSSNETYFDGTYAGAGWYGTPNNSASFIPNPNNIPLYDAYADNNNIMSVESGEVARFIITSGVYPTSILRPVPVDTLPINVGNYHVIDSTGLPIIAQQWVDYGGEVNVAVGDGVGEIVVTITAPDSDIPSTTGPYRLAASDGDNEYAALMVAGTGVITDPRTLNLLTGADRDRVTQELAATINSPFVNTLDDAYTVGTWLSAYSNGHYPVIDFTIPTSALGGVGLGPGSTFIARDCKYRVASVNWSNASCSGTAIQYSTAQDYQDAIGSRTIGDHQALWGDYTLRDFGIKSHRTV